MTLMEPRPKFQKETGLCLTSAILKLDEDNKTSLSVSNVLLHNITISKNPRSLE